MINRMHQAIRNRVCILAFGAFLNAGVAPEPEAFFNAEDVGPRSGITWLLAPLQGEVHGWGCLQS